MAADETAETIDYTDQHAPGPRWVVRPAPDEDPDDWGTGAFAGSHATAMEALDALDALARYWASEATADGGDFAAALEATSTRLYVEELA